MIRKLLVLAAASRGAGGHAQRQPADGPSARSTSHRASSWPARTRQVGFTIRQHGQTPVNPDSGTIGIRLVNQASGQAFEFAATQTGPTGHYVATVRVPTAGSWSWEVLQGWFAPQDLGTIAVVGSGGAAGAAASPAAAPDRARRPARPGPSGGVSAPSPWPACWCWPS